MSGDPEQEYFTDGISEDIITGLSRVRWLFVIARNSTFTYKGQGGRCPAGRAELGVRYVLEGSVRGRATVFASPGNLIDAETGAHIWAERYDRQLDDIFDVQDEITQNVIASNRASPDTRSRASEAVNQPPDNVAA